MTGQPHVLGLARGADGFYVLELLGLDGWSVAVTAHDQGVRVRACRGSVLVERVGASVADVALRVFEAARAVSRADADMQIVMGKIARAVRSRRFEDALLLMGDVWDGNLEAAAYALREVFNVDVAAAYPWLTPRLP